MCSVTHLLINLLAYTSFLEKPKEIIINDLPCNLGDQRCYGTLKTVASKGIFGRGGAEPRARLMKALLQHYDTSPAFFLPASQYSIHTYIA